VGLLLRKTLFKGVSSGFIMELPPYMMPRLSNVAIKTWERTKRFLFKAGTVIFLATVMVWLLSVTGPGGYLGPEALEDPQLIRESWVGILGQSLASTVFSLMGWDWRAAVALFFGFIAKEIVVSSMAILYGVGEEKLMDVIAESQAFTPLTAYAYMAFVLIYVPCLATLAMVRNELGLKYAFLALIYEVLLAYIVSLSIIGVGSVLGFK